MACSELRKSPVANVLDSYCTSDCFPTCVCPPDHVENEGKCIKREECPCIHQNQVYKSGDKERFSLLIRAIYKAMFSQYIYFVIIINNNLKRSVL